MSRRLPVTLAGAFAVAVAIGCACGKAPDCPEGEHDRYGTCVPDDCGDYPFGGFAGRDAVFVEARSYADDEDGSQRAPFRTLAPAIALATSRADRPPVVIASGSYPESLTLDDRHDGLLLQGVCQRDVVLSGSGSDAPTLDLEATSASGVQVSSVTVRSDVSAGVVVGGGHLALVDVDVVGGRGAGIAAVGAGATLELSDVSVSGTRTTEDLPSGYGLAVGDGAAVTGFGLTVRDSEVAGIFAEGPATIVWLSDAAVDGNPLDVEGTVAAGVVVTAGASFTASDLTVTSAWAVGVSIEAATADLTRLTIAGTRATDALSDGTLAGAGLAVRTGAVVDVVDLVITGTELYGVLAADDGSVLALDGAEVRDSAPAPGVATAGIGLVVSDGATVTASGLSLARNHVYGGVVSGDGASLTLTDSEVVDTAPTDDGVGPLGALAGGLGVQDGASLDATGLTVAGCGTIGIFADDASAALHDVAVTDTTRGTFQSVGVGVAAQFGATLAADGLSVERTEGPGLFVSDAVAACVECALTANAFAGAAVVTGGALTLDAPIVVGTTPDATEGGGVGLFVSDSDGPRTTVVVAGGAFRDNAHAGVYVDGDASVSLTGVTLSGGPATRPLWPTGTAVFASGTTIGGLALSGNAITGSDGAGLFVDGGSATLDGDVYSDNAVDVVQQLCRPEDTLVGLESEQLTTIDVCPAYDRPVDAFSLDVVYAPIALE